MHRTGKKESKKDILKEEKKIRLRKICFKGIRAGPSESVSGANFGNILIDEKEKRENEIICLSIIFSVISSSEFGVLLNLLLQLRNKTVKIRIPDTDAEFFFFYVERGRDFGRSRGRGFAFKNGS